MAQRFGGDWTEEKLDCISDYLRAYTIALKNKPFPNRPFQKLYIDAFAGTGYRELRKKGTDEALVFQELAGEDTARFLDGSVRRALQVESRFQRYIFIEKSPSKFRWLQQLTQEFPDHTIEPVRADANSYLLDLLANVNWRGTRAVLFLDPFGMEVDWSTLKAIAATQAIDLWYLFPLSAVNRMLVRKGDMPDSWRDRLDRVFGTNEWYDAFYKRQTVPTLFEPVDVTEKLASTRAIQEFVLERLRTVFPAVANGPLVLENSGATPLFLLCFAVSNPRGQHVALKIANHILNKRKRRG